MVHLLHIQIHNSPKISPEWPHEVALDPASALLAHLLPLTDGLAGDLPISVMNIYVGQCCKITHLT